MGQPTRLHGTHIFFVYFVHAVACPICRFIFIFFLCSPLVVPFNFAACIVWKQKLYPRCEGTHNICAWHDLCSQLRTAAANGSGNRQPTTTKAFIAWLLCWFVHRHAFSPFREESETNTFALVWWVVLNYASQQTVRSSVSITTITARIFSSIFVANIASLAISRLEWAHRSPHHTLTQHIHSIQWALLISLLLHKIHWRLRFRIHLDIFFFLLLCIY